MGWVRAGPDPEKDGVVRWRRVDLRKKIAATFDKSVLRVTFPKPAKPEEKKITVKAA